MNRISLRIRLVTACAALTTTFVLFHTVATFSRPVAIEQMALAKKSLVIVAAAR